MTLEHLSETQLARYGERSLDTQELLAVDRHLASCDMCHERLTRLSPGASILFESGDEPFHLDYEQHLEPYVDGRVNEIDREIVDSHVASCSRCATDLKDLLEFKRQQPVVAIVETSSRRRQWFPQLPLPAWAAAAAVAAVCVLSGAVFLWTRNPASETFQKVSPEAERQPSPAVMNHLENLPSPSPEALEKPLLVINDAGCQIKLNKDGHLEGLDQLPPDLKDSVQRALATHRLGASPALKGWSTETLNLRSGSMTPSTFAPLEPLEVVIETDRPTFRWRPLEGTEHCTVTIFDAKLRQVASSGPVTQSQWTIPTALQRGVTYSWQIATVKAGETIVSPKPPLPEARFRVLDQRTVNALASLRLSVGTSHLAMGVFYWKHGLLADAEREFQALLKANPDSTVVKELLKDIATKRHIKHKQ